MSPTARNQATLAAVAAVAAFLFGTSAFAAGTHFQPPNGEPTFRDLGLALRASGDLAGLGNENVLISLEATADVTSTCTNQGGNAAPGQNPAPLTVIGSEPIPASEIKNGRTPFQVDTEEPDTPIEGAPGCSNSNWTETIDDLAFTSATITVEQPPGTTVLTIECTFDPPTSDGRVPAGDVTCESF